MTHISLKVSVIMAVYNTQQHVGEAIESILNQTYTDFELIVVNDGSQDNSLSVIQSYTDSRIRLISRENKGVAISRNEAIKVAQGTYTAIMDSDDISTLDRLEKQVQFLQNNPDVIAVGGQLMRCDKHLNPLKMWSYATKVLSYQHAYDFAYGTPHGGIMVCTQYIKQVLYRPYFWAAEDYDMLLRLWDKGDFANIPDTVLYYRWHGTNVRLSLRIWRSCLSVVTANMCAVLRRTGRSDAFFDNPQLSRADGFLLHKTDVTHWELIKFVYSIGHICIYRWTILILRRLLRRK